MALIELNLEKPALKRTELVEESEVETAEEPETETETAEETDVEETKGGSKIRTFARRAAVLGGTAAGLAAVRKLQQKRSGTDEEQQELEEDWQTAE
ncbi:hypothetical protein BG842_10510 [Haladaptatus sp. W1]|uniref:hypothetical protein n=1 Tax=Haladaptatus sp. W1 TaxID=1897478 RepID=UPI0008498B6D|nr:hypothetical protein [Haladaptatus sp. W1]ODR83546.1 hypothetical protein BG842_10510 [Haladaptatus sp. W1]